MPVKVTARDVPAEAAKQRRWPGIFRGRPTRQQTAPPVPAPPALVYAGIFFGEAGSDRNGLWTTERFSLPVPTQGPGAVRFEAFHPESLFLQAEALEPPAQAPVTCVSFHLAGREIAGYLIEGEGDFSIDLVLPPPHAPVAILDVAVSRSFRPGVIWQSADTRRLSLLLKLVRVDGLAVIDNTAARAFIPVEDIVVQLPGINVIGYVKAEMGLGEAARACVRSARAADIPVCVLDAGFQTLHRQQDGVAEGDATVRPVNLLHVNAEQCGPLRRFLADNRPEFLRADYTIGYWAWEQPDFPTDYLPCFEGIHEIWTPSSFVQAAISAIAPVPVLRMPHAVHAIASPLARRANFGLPEGMFLTLVTYDFYSYQHRKNPQAAIAAYLEARRAGAAIGLVIKTINGDKVPAALDALRRELIDVPDVVFIDRYLDRQAMFDLEACCDCLLSLHRAEGFGLGLAEMMCLGKPVVATNWSGNVDFMNAANAMPVDYTLTPLAEDTGPYRAGSLWAEADPHHAAAQLIRLAGDPALAQSLGRRAQADMAHYSAAAIGRLFRRRLAIIEATARNGRRSGSGLSRPGA